MKINKLIYVAIIGALFASCQKVETPMFTDADAFVAFEKEKINVTKNIGREVRIPVSLVSISGFDATVDFEIDTIAYENTGIGAKEGVNFIVKNETKTLTFKKGENMTDYIVIEPIDFSGDLDVTFDIKLVSLKGDCSLGAYNTMAVTIGDGLSGTYKASAPSPFEGQEDVVNTWTCEVRKDRSNPNMLWFSQIVPSYTGAVYNEVAGEMDDSHTSVTVGGGEIGTMDYNGEEVALTLDFNGALSTTGQISSGKITFTSIMLISAYMEYNGEYGNYLITGAKGVTLTKVEDY